MLLLLVDAAVVLIMILIARAVTIIIIIIIIDSIIIIVVVRTVMLFVIRRRVQASLLDWCSISRRLSEEFNVDVVDIQVYIVVLKFTFLKFRHQTMRAFVLAEPTCDLIRVNPQSQLDRQL